jgi:membrane protease YdiL (CAAX protease family)
VNERTARVGSSLIRLTVSLVVFVVLWWLIGGLLAQPLGILMASALSIGLAMLITTAMMMRLYETRSFLDVGLFFNGIGAHHFGLGLALGAGSSLAIVAVHWAAGWVRFERVAFLPHGFLTVSVWFGVLLIGAMGEELLFRGYPFQQVIRAAGPWFSILFAAFLFAWMHSANPAFSRIGMLNTTVFGLLFGYAYWRTRDLWLPLGMHFAWNFTLAIAGANVSGLKIKLMGISMVVTGPPAWSGGEYGPEASLITTMVLIGVGAFLWKAPLERQRRGLLADEGQHS